MYRGGHLFSYSDATSGFLWLHKWKNKTTQNKNKISQQLYFLVHTSPWRLIHLPFSLKQPTDGGYTIISGSFFFFFYTKPFHCPKWHPPFLPGLGAKYFALRCRYHFRSPMPVPRLLQSRLWWDPHQQHLGDDRSPLPQHVSGTKSIKTLVLFLIIAEDRCQILLILWAPLWCLPCTAGHLAARLIKGTGKLSLL